MSKEKYVDVPVDFSDEMFMKIARAAHEQNITFNQFCVNALESFVKLSEEEQHKIIKEFKNEQ